MSKQFTVPTRLEKAAKELKDNMVILKGCSPEVKEVMALAAKQKCLTYWNDHGYKEVPFLEVGGDRHKYAYCLPDDVEIVVEPVEPVAPEWVSKKYTVCEVEPFLSECFKMKRPDGTVSEVFGLPAVIYCKGWIFKGWLHNGCDLIESSPILYRDGNSFWSALSSSQDREGCTTSIAYATVWQKAESK